MDKIAMDSTSCVKKEEPSTPKTQQKSTKTTPDSSTSPSSTTSAETVIPRPRHHYISMTSVIKEQDRQPVNLAKKFADLTLLVGPEKIPMVVHTCVLANLSKYFDNGCTIEPLPASAGATLRELELPTMDVDTMQHVLSFLYTFDYKLPVDSLSSSDNNINETNGTSGSNDNKTTTIINQHKKVLAAADSLDISSLRILSIQKIETGLLSLFDSDGQWTDLSTALVLELLSFIIKHTGPTELAHLDILLTHAARAEMMQQDGFLDLLAGNGGFAVLVMDKLHNKLAVLDDPRVEKKGKGKVVAQDSGGGFDGF